MELNGLYLGGVTMANLKSAIKRIRTNDTKRLRNQSFKSEMRSQIKQVETLIEANDVENAKVAFQAASKKIDKTVQKGIIHKNNGNRQKSRLAKKLKSLSA
jgi:small subunit ribosomal protein S20